MYDVQDYGRYEHAPTSSPVDIVSYGNIKLADTDEHPAGTHLILLIIRTTPRLLHQCYRISTMSLCTHDAAVKTVSRYHRLHGEPS